MVHRMEVKNKLLPVPSNRRSRKKGHSRGWRDRVTSGSPANRKLALGRKVGIPDRRFSRGFVECSFGQVMLHFRSFGHIMLQEASQCFHTQTESKTVTVAISCFIWSDYGSTDKPALHRQIKTASIREEDHADKVFRHP